MVLLKLESFIKNWYCSVLEKTEFCFQYFFMESMISFSQCSFKLAGLDFFFARLSHLMSCHFSKTMFPSDANRILYTIFIRAIHINNRLHGLDQTSTISILLCSKKRLCNKPNSNKDRFYPQKKPNILQN